MTRRLGQDRATVRGRSGSQPSRDCSRARVHACLNLDRCSYRRYEARTWIRKRRSPIARLVTDRPTLLHDECPWTGHAESQLTKFHELCVRSRNCKAPRTPDLEQFNGQHSCGSRRRYRVRRFSGDHPTSICACETAAWDQHGCTQPTVAQRTGRGFP